MDTLRLPAGALVVLVAPSGSGKSTWARRNLGDHVIVSSDQLRSVVGADEHDQRASADAFDVLDRIVAARCGRKLTTVVDSTGLQAERRATYRQIADDAGVPCHAVVLDVPEREARARNKARARTVPSKVLTGQWEQFLGAKAVIGDEGFTAVHVVTDLDAPARFVGSEVIDAVGLGAQSASDGPELHLHLGRFDLAGDEARGGQRDLAAIARTAEEVGFAGIWVMDHLTQIPQVGRAWDDLPEAWTALAWMAAHTRRIRLGSLVSPVTFRPMAVLGKAVATLDVLSGGRVTCGLGLGWFDSEHRDLGVAMPEVDHRYDLLEDHLRGLPVLWGSGTGAFEGKVVSMPKATCYPRPAQKHLPILVGGNGPRRTLALAAEHAQAVNVQGDPAAIEAAVLALDGHLRSVDRTREDITVSARVRALTRPSAEALDAAVRIQSPSSVPTHEWAASVGAATVEDQVLRMRGLGALGVQQVMVSASEATVDGIAQFAAVIDALR